MNHVLSTHAIINHRLTVNWLDKIRLTGIPAVEIYCARQHLDYRDKAQIRELGHWFRDADLKLHSLHAPLYTDDVWGRSGPSAVITITERVKSKRLGMVEEIKRALEIAELIPFRYMVQHLGVGGEEYDDAKLDAAFSSLEEIKLFAGQRGVEVILENTPNALSSAERLMYFLGLTHLNMGFCFDLGHAQMMEGIDAAFTIMKDRIRSTHIHDNDGVKDLHLFPFAEGGKIDWPAAMRLLKSRPDQYPLLLELSEDTTLANPFEKIAAVFDKLENLQ